MERVKEMNEPQILLTNDDGIRSPGLWAAAEALDELGFVTVVAPREQSSGTGRSMPSTSDGQIHPQQIEVNGKMWTVHAVGGTPAQAVLHGLLEVMDVKPDLVVSGINYGLNVGTGITVSGTVGAALEGGSAGIPSIAVSQDAESRYHLSYSEEIDFKTAGHFTARFARMLLNKELPEDVHVLKVEIPVDADPETPWEITRLSPVRYYTAVVPDREKNPIKTNIGYRVADDWHTAPPKTDVHAVRIKQIVSVTPLSLDLTSRVDLDDLESQLRS